MTDNNSQRIHKLMRWAALPPPGHDSRGQLRPLYLAAIAQQRDRIKAKPYRGQLRCRLDTLTPLR